MPVVQGKHEGPVQVQRERERGGEGDNVDDGGGRGLGALLVHLDQGLVQDLVDAQQGRVGQAAQLTLVWIQQIKMIIYKLEAIQKSQM